jgi:hypothetical protein
MNTNDNTEGPALALSVLYEANDLLNIFRSHSEDSLGQKLTSGEWTLTCEIKRRLDAAIAHLDGAVPHPAEADDSEAGKPANDDETEGPGYELLMDLQIQVGELQGVAQMAGEVCADADDVLSMIARRAAAIVDEMNHLIPFVKGGAA